MFSEQSISNILALLTLLSHIFILIFLFIIVANKFKPLGFIKKLFILISKNAVWLALIVALAALAGSLFFSEIMGLAPCKLCWYQRIFIYPLTFILGLAWIIKDRLVWRYVRLLSLIGGAIAAYQYWLQLVPSSSQICSLDSLESCGQIILFYYGYITIPLMSFTACLLIFILGTIAAENNK